MRKYISLFFFVSLFVWGCDETKSPKGIIDHDHMVNLLTEVHIIDGSLYSVRQDPDTLYKYGTARYLVLFKRFHTDSTQFRHSLQYYAAQPTELQDIYTQVALNLKQKTDSLTKTQLNITRPKPNSNTSPQPAHHALPEK